MKKIKGYVGLILSYLILFITPFKTRKKCLNTKETIEYLLNNDVSLIRYGDGEFCLYLDKKGICYQEYNEELMKYLQLIEKDYTKKSNYLLAIPYKMFSENILWFLKNKKIYVTCFAKYRLYFKIFMNNDCLYGDAMCFAKGYEREYNKLWDKAKYIIFVHNDIKWAKIFKQKYKKDLFFVEIPNKNGYNTIENTKSEIIKIIQENNLQKEEYKILISAGPAAKVLVYKLLECNITSYDVGHVWDEPLIVEEKDGEVEQGEGKKEY